MDAAHKGIRLLKSLWPSKIRYQLILGVAAVHLTLMTLFVFDLVERQRDFLLNENMEETRSLVHTLAINSSSWVLANDVVGLGELINSMQQHPELRYAMVIDQDGKVMAHTDRSKVGLFVKDTRSISLLKAKPQVMTLHSNHALLDVAAPILSSTGKCVGWARIGHGQENIARSLSIVSKNGILYTLLAILVGSVFATLIGYRLTSGLNRLLSVSRQIRNGQRDLRMDITHADEISRLGRGLNQMLDSMVANENEIQDLYNNAPCGYHSLDKDGKFVRINDTELSWLGYSRDEIVGKKKFSDVITPESSEIFRENYPVFKERGRINDLEFEMVRRDGTVMPVLLSATAIKDADGTFIMSRSTIYDITEQKRAEEVAKVANAYNRSLIESSLDPLVTIGPDGKITDVNFSTESVTGYGREKLIGTDFSDYFTEPDKAREGYQQVFREGTVRDFALEIRHRDGHVIPVLYNASVYRNAAGDVIGVFAAARDVTERKRVEEALQKSEQRLQLHVRQTPLAVIEWDTDFHVISWNPAAENVFGYSAAEALGRHAEFIVPVSARPHVDRIWNDLLLRKGGERSTNENVTKNGRTILCEWYNTPLITAEGRVIGVTSLVQDITERKRAEEALNRLNQELEQRVKERTAELESKNEELQKMNRLFVGRELRMIEIKEKIRELEKSHDKGA